VRLDIRKNEAKARFRQVGSSVCTMHFIDFGANLHYTQGASVRDSQAELRISDSQMAALESKFDQAFESVQELISFLSAARST